MWTVGEGIRLAKLLRGLHLGGPSNHHGPNPKPTPNLPPPPGNCHARKLVRVPPNKLSGEFSGSPPPANLSGDSFGQGPNSPKDLRGGVLSERGLVGTHGLPRGRALCPQAPEHPQVRRPVPQRGVQRSDPGRAVPPPPQVPPPALAPCPPVHSPRRLPATVDLCR